MARRRKPGFVPDAIVAALKKRGVFVAKKQKRIAKDAAVAAKARGLFFAKKRKTAAKKIVEAAKKRKALFIPVPTAGYKKLSPKQLAARGLSPKSERYIDASGRIISKRRYQESKLQERKGRRFTLEERARALWRRLTGRGRAAAAGRRRQVATAREAGVYKAARKRTVASQLTKEDQERYTTLNEAMTSGRAVSAADYNWMRDLENRYEGDPFFNRFISVIT